MAQLIGTGRMNRSGGSGTLTIPVPLAKHFDLDDDGVDVVYVKDDDGDIRIKRADQIEL